MTIRKTSAAIAIFNETVKATNTMMVLLTRLPTIGTNPQRNVTAMRSGACGRRTLTTNIPVKAVLISEMVSCAPMTVAKQR